MDGYGSSILEQWTWILWAIESSKHPHERILDVGAGHGKAAVLIYEYLNVKPLYISAIEPNPDMRARLVRMYEAVYERPVQDYPAAGWDDYDTVLMADVIEHMQFGEGFDLIT